MFLKFFSLLFSILISHVCLSDLGELSQSVTHQLKLSPGKVVLFEFEAKDKELEELKCKDKKIPFFKEGNKIKTYISESYFSTHSSYQCLANFKDTSIPIAEVKVESHLYPEENIFVDKKRVFLTKKRKKRVIRESEMLKKIYSNSHPEKLFNEAFSLPLESMVTSKFGTKRIYNKKKSTQHLGTDFRAKAGIPVKNSNSGKVVFTGNLFFTGNTVIVDHGLGIFTVYAHLSEIKVKEGDFVNKNTVVALTGMTGRVSGPHLHWGVKVHDNWIDGSSLVTSGI